MDQLKFLHQIMDKHYENLTKLYLRLNGFVVSNLILHSE